MKLAVNFSGSPPVMKLNVKRIRFSSVPKSAAYSLMYTNTCHLNLLASLTSMKSSGFLTCFLPGAAVTVVTGTAGAAVGAVAVVAAAIIMGGVGGRGGTVGVTGDSDG